MNQFIGCFIWLRRVFQSRGFGIQSPSDYSFVRYVVNEHLPYYAYDELSEQNWLKRKLGRLYFRLSNWRQPSVMLFDDYQPYWQAGCKHTEFTSEIKKVELARLLIEDEDGWKKMLDKCDDHSIIVVEGIWRNWERWHQIEKDERTSVTFDLYYCGIVFFDKERYKHNYVINF